MTTLIAPSKPVDIEKLDSLYNDLGNTEIELQLLGLRSDIDTQAASFAIDLSSAIIAETLKPDISNPVEYALERLLFSMVGQMGRKTLLSLLAKVTSQLD